MQDKEFEILRIRDLAQELNLDLKPIDIEMKDEESDPKLFVYYKSHKRIDFRLLCRRLHGVYKCRIEMRRLTNRQIAQRLGGITTCKHSRIPCFVPWCHTSRWGGCFYDKEEESVHSDKRTIESEG